MNAASVDAFRDVAQRARACQALLLSGGLGHLWTEDGPTDEAQRLADVSGACLAGGARVLFLATWALWSGTETPLRFDELQGLIEADGILTLTLAANRGPDAVDVWLRTPLLQCGPARSAAEVRSSAAALFGEAGGVFERPDGAVDLGSASHACAFGALQMADFVLLVGVSPIDDDERRLEAAKKLTGDVLKTATAVHAGGGEDEEQGIPSTERAPC